MANPFGVFRTAPVPQSPTDTPMGAFSRRFAGRQQPLGGGIAGPPRGAEQGLEQLLGLPRFPSPNVGGVFGQRLPGGQVPGFFTNRDLGRTGFLEAPRRGRGSFAMPTFTNRNNLLSLLRGGV